MDGTLLIDNKRITTEQKITSINPATLEPLGDVCLATEDHCQTAVQAAKNAFVSWKETPGNKKRQIFKNAKKILLQNSREIATLITEEHGSPLPESLSMEIWGAAEDLERAVLGAVWAGFMNCGQSCGSVERVYVDRNIAKEFTARVVERTRKLRVGNPMEPEVDIGPMTTRSQLSVVKDHIDDAKTRGAQVIYGNIPYDSLPGYFIQPTVLTDVNHSMKIMTEETFGPVLPTMTFSDPEEAITLVNDSSLGLTASIWTRNKKLAKWMANRLETGTVTVNDHMSSFAEPGAIWGGVKQSGIGRSHGHFGQLDLMNIKYISHDFKKKRKLVWWFPYDAEMTTFMEKAITLFHGDRIGKKLKTLVSLAPQMSRILATLPITNLIRVLPKIFKK